MRCSRFLIGTPRVIAAMIPRRSRWSSTRKWKVTAAGRRAWAGCAIATRIWLAWHCWRHGIQPNPTQPCAAWRQVVIIGRPDPGSPAAQVAAGLMTGRAKRRDEERILVLHGRVLAGDADAAEELAALVLPRVRRGLQAAAPREAPEAIDTAVDDAVMIYLRDPTKYDSSRASLLTWVDGIAHKCLKHLQRERRRLARERPGGVDFSAYAIVAAPDGAADAAEREIVQRESLRTAARTLGERALVEAKLEGAPMEAQVQACGLHVLPESKARTIIYRMWENLVRRAKRALKAQA